MTVARCHGSCRLEAGARGPATVGVATLAACVALSTCVALSACGGLAADGPSQNELVPGGPETEPSADARERNGRDPERDRPGRDRSEPAPASESPLDDSLLDDTLSAMIDDLSSVPPDERSFMRYVAVSHVRNIFDERSDRASTAASDLEGARDVRRLAVVKLVNGTSTSPVVARLPPTGRERLYQRIDLRAHGWDSPVAVGGQGHRDGWEAIVAHAAQAVPFDGPEAELLRDMSGSDVPWLMADDFVATAAAGDVYYELMRAPETLDGLQRQLAEASGDPLLEVRRAGLGFSLLSFNARMIERRGGPESGLWQALDFADAARGQTIFSDPLSLAPDGTEVIFSLPNGFRGYFIADGAGRRTPVSPLPVSVITDPSQPDGVMRNGASCFSCHNSGLIPFRDQVRELVPSLPLAQQAPALEQFPEAGVLEALARDDDRRYLDALLAAGVSAEIEDPISRVYRGFGEDLGPLQAAGELFVEPAVLAREVSGLPGALAGLASPSARIGRAAFTSVYVQALCRLHAASENRPRGC